MAEQLVTTAIEKTGTGAVAVITLDDGNKNVLSPDMLDQINAALDQAEKHGAVVLLTGRDGIFSAGFDLKRFKKGLSEATRMLMGGFRLTHRMLSFPTPIVAASPGHAIAMGSFIMASADYRFCADLDVKITANEVAIGMTMPHSVLEICSYRLKPSYLDRSMALAEVYNPHTAVEAGYMDKVVAADALQDEALALAKSLTQLDMKAHRQTKLRMRKTLLRRIRCALWKDHLGIYVMAIKTVLGKK